MFLEYFNSVVECNEYCNSVVECNEWFILPLIETYILGVKFINHEHRNKEHEAINLTHFTLK